MGSGEGLLPERKAGEPANIERHIDHAKYYMRVGQAGTQYSMSKGQTNIGHSLLSKTKY